MKLRRRRRFLIGLIIAGCIGFVLCIGFQFRLFYLAQSRGMDFLFRIPGADIRTETTSKIIVIAIDDKSLDELGKFSSWPRSYHADLINLFTEAKTKLVVFDILFSEPTSWDDALLSSIKANGKVVLPVAGTSINTQSSRVNKVIEYDSILRPLTVFQEEALAVGHANMVPDEDGVVRRSPLVIHSGDDYEMALALVAAAEYKRDQQIIEFEIGDKFMQFDDQKIPIDDLKAMWINYTGNYNIKGVPTGFQIVSYVDVLRGRIDPAEFKDSLVIIGATAIGLGDNYWIPTGQRVSGVEIHANAVRTILSGNFLSPVHPAVTILAILLLSIVCGIVVLRFRVIWAALSAIFLCAIYLIALFSLFDEGIMMNIVYPPLTILCSFVGLILYRINYEQSEKREITKIFGRYVPRQVVDRILTIYQDGELKLGGEEHEITVMFADIRGFTSISDRIDPDNLIKALNVYLSIIIKAVFKYDGMVNKFGGDSVVAVWNIPVDNDQHALLAVKAAIDAQSAVKDLHMTDNDVPVMDFGIGINTGKAVAGNMGSEERLEYAVIGDAVNIASRLTDVAPGGKVWIGSSTFELVKDNITAKQLKPLSIKGKTRLITAYEVEDYIC